MPDRADVVDQIYDRSRLLNAEKHEDSGNVAYEALHSAAYSGLQAPIKGVAQLADHTLGTNIADKVEFMSAPKAADFGSMTWHAQQIGGAVGMIAPFMAVNKGVGSFLGKEAAVAETMTLRAKMTQAMISGGVYEGVMRPVEDNEGNFWAARARHATVGAATFATLTATAHGLDGWAKAPFRNEIFNNTVAGIAAGSTNAQLESLMSGKGFASYQDTIRGGYTFGVVGFGMKSFEHAIGAGSPESRTKFEESPSVRELRTDLKDVPVRTESGAVTDVFTKIMEQPNTVLLPEQKARIMDILADARDNYYSIDNALEPGAKNKGYQVVNWKHTRGEIDQVLESAKLDKTMTPQQTEDAILASIFSDSVKTPENFIRHHLDGAKRAEEILPKYFDATTPEGAARIKGIVEAAKEHQIGPPGFMGMMTQMFIRNAIKGDMTKGAKEAFGEKMPEAEQKVFDGVVAKLMKPADHAVDGKIALNADETALLDRIGVPKWKIENATDINGIQAKIAKPFESVSAQNPGVVDFSKTQHDYLKLIGLDDWYVPNKETPWYNASRKVINGDSLINYASPDGWAKIAQIRGPGTIFTDKTIWDSLNSAKSSYDDAATVITDDVRPLAEQGLARTQAAVERVKPAVQQWVNEHKEAFGYRTDEKVSFWDKDAAPLKYPDATHPLEAQDALRLDFARQIRDKMVAELRAQQGNYSDRP